MTVLLAAALALSLQAAPAWTWALYDSDGRVALANEVPDTPMLRATLECDKGSGVARLSVYEAGAATGFVRVSSGAATAMVEAPASRDDALQLVLRTDHPVFAAFAASGQLTVAVGDLSRVVEVERPHLAKLQTFAGLCGA